MKLKKAIKSRDPLPPISTVSRNYEFIKKLGKRWSNLGLSLKNILKGIILLQSPHLLILLCCIIKLIEFNSFKEIGLGFKIK